MVIIALQGYSTQSPAQLVPIKLVTRLHRILALAFQLVLTTMRSLN